MQHVLSSVEKYDRKFTQFLGEYHKIRNNVFLDVGCGWGALVVSIAIRGWQVVGVDINRNAINLARTLACEHDVQDKISFIIADARKLPFPDRGFLDGFVSLLAFEHISMLKLL